MGAPGRAASDGASSATAYGARRSAAGPRAGVRLRRSGVNRRDLRLKLSQNCHGQGESDCLIKTERLDRLKSFLRDVISAQCSECQSEEIRISAGKRRE